MSESTYELPSGKAAVTASHRFGEKDYLYPAKAGAVLSALTEALDELWKLKKERDQPVPTEITKAH